MKVADINFSSLIFALNSEASQLQAALLSQMAASLLSDAMELLEPVLLRFLDTANCWAAWWNCHMPMCVQEHKATQAAFKSCILFTSHLEILSGREKRPETAICHQQTVGNLPCHPTAFAPAVWKYRRRPDSANEANPICSTNHK